MMFLIIGGFAFGNSVAQDPNDTDTASPPKEFKVKPGKSIGELEIGMFVEDVEQLLGTPHERWFYEDEVDRVKDAGLDQTDLYYFRVGFDEVFKYDLAPEAYPITQMYFLGNRLVYVMMVENRSGNGKLLLKKGIRFGDPKLRLLKRYGDPAIKLDFEGGEGNYIYPSKGLEFFFHYDRIKKINVFRPVKDVINSQDCD